MTKVGDVMLVPCRVACVKLIFSIRVEMFGCFW